MKTTNKNATGFVIRDANNNAVSFTGECSNKSREVVYAARDEAEAEMAVILYNCDDLNLPLHVIPAGK